MLGPLDRIAWRALCLLAAAAPLLTAALPASVLQWQPELAWLQPWRWWTPIAVHYSLLHLGANLAAVLLLALLGAAAGCGARAALAWALAWPLTHLGLLAQPALQHYGGLSGWLHAGVAVVALQLLRQPPAGRRRWVGLALLFGLAVKIVLEAPWQQRLLHPPGWDIAVAPAAHLSGTLAGLLCAGLWLRPPRPRARPSPCESG